MVIETNRSYYSMQHEGDAIRLRRTSSNWEANLNGLTTADKRIDAQQWEEEVIPVHEDFVTIGYLCTREEFYNLATTLRTFSSQAFAKMMVEITKYPNDSQRRTYNPRDF